jgi:hypothetical protein
VPLIAPTSIPTSTPTSVPVPTADVTASSDGVDIATAASRALPSTVPQGEACPPYLLGSFLDDRTGEIVKVFHRVCNGMEEFIDLSNAAIQVVPQAP